MNIRDRIPVCPHAPRADISTDLIASLERLEKFLGHELKYTSGFRCEGCNRKVGGVEHSAHTRGTAVDVSCLIGSERMLLVTAVLSLGYRRVGIGKTFVHLDVDLTLPQHVLWLY